MEHLKDCIKRINENILDEICKFKLQITDETVVVYDEYECFDYDLATYDKVSEMLDAALELDTFKGNYFDFESAYRLEAPRKEN